MAKLPVFDSFDAKTGSYHLQISTKPTTARHVLTYTSGLGYPFTSATLRDFKPRAGSTRRERPMSDPDTPPSRRPHSANAIAFLIFGSLLLVPGVCVIIVNGMLGSLTNPTVLLWVGCLMVALGALLVYKAFQKPPAP